MHTLSKQIQHPVGVLKIVFHAESFDMPNCLLQKNFMAALRSRSQEIQRKRSSILLIEKKEASAYPPTTHTHTPTNNAT